MESVRLGNSIAQRGGVGIGGWWVSFGAWHRRVIKLTYGADMTVSARIAYAAAGVEVVARKRLGSRGIGSPIGGLRAGYSR